MRLDTRFVGWAFGSTALIAALVAAGFFWLGTATPRAQSAAARPVLRGDMGEFSYFGPPRPVPPTSFLDAEGKTRQLADYKGRVVLLNFWATWCAPCVKEMPSLDRLEAKLGGKDFVVLDLSLDRQGKEAVAPYFATNKLSHLGVYLDPKGEAFRAWQGQGVPTSFIIGRDGLAQGTLMGPAAWDSPAAVAFIQHFIAEGSGKTTLAPVEHTGAGGRAIPAG